MTDKLREDNTCLSNLTYTASTNTENVFNNIVYSNIEPEPASEYVEASGTHTPSTFSLTYSNKTILDTINNELKILTPDKLCSVSVDINNWSESSISLPGGQDIVLDALGNIFVITSTNFTILDSAGSTISDISGYIGLSGITHSSIENIAAIVGNEQLYIIDTMDTTTPVEISNITDTQLSYMYRICFNENASKAYGISRINNKLLQIDTKDKVLPVVESTYISEYLMDPRCILFDATNN